jgi:hypothetical protein
MGISYGIVGAVGLGVELDWVLVLGALWISLASLIFIRPRGFVP